MTTGAGEDIAAWFLISSQRIGGEPKKPRGELHKLSFFVIITLTIKNYSK
tara:strand:+ start:1205 stop:1354 length:150 start_codon:yes stop_codon:yes gene_type:complete